MTMQIAETFGLTIAGARRAVASALRAAGIETPELDARLLVGHAVGLDHASLAANGDQVLGPEASRRLAACVEQRVAHKPVARIVGEREFWGLPLRLNEATLVPRPETETVVEAALAALDEAGRRNDPLRILDIAAGSGALLLALVSELKNAHGIGTDIALRAIEMAAENARRLGFADRAKFVACDFACAVRGPFDLIVANPPYIARAEIVTLAPEVRDFDPRIALDGGTDGLAAYRTIAADLARLLARDGLAVVELGIGQEQAVAGLLTEAGLAVAPARPDLGGIPRALTARLAPADGPKISKKSLGL